ncbi:aminoglycoside phosphotransferase family protein [Pyxidicoccus xibeiensis]|uniref:aminoglycoside phosphotransferase family protein n=1 Tax=Pyxidicoccus xibeiensis TaxID=2906759 RepID=UPI0020A77D33|nr:aminoglycoside phosphotransferase family protein [Pyxidicoccus xibeiensis]MCP3135850.1 aminoglycoside phosphotransferase family protein [Pyxidicoccus xibeiensis]
MVKESVSVPEAVRRRALSRGPEGEAWLAGLDAVVADLAREWGLSIARSLSGGTEAFVAEVSLADGRQAVLKVAPPGSGLAERELRTLLAARGRGYAEVYRHDRGREAVLLERLGPPLADAGLSVDAQLEVLCATLAEAWAPLPEGGHLMTGAEKARFLAELIERAWLELERPCPERVIETALRYAELRQQGFDPATAVLSHGDAHPWNTLLVPGEPAGRYKFVDPDGLFVERAYDLGILMREWTSELLRGDPLVLGGRRCRRLAALTGVDAESIWQWGFIESTSTGLHCLQVGLESGRELLTVAELWAGGLLP